MRVGLRRVERCDKEVIKHLWDLYSYDFSVYNGEDILTNGEYDFYYNDEYFDNPDKVCYFIMVDDKYAGFVSTSHVCYTLTKETDRCIVDFFVMNKYRKGGVGRKSAYQLFDMFPVRWEVAQYDNNQVSKLFWEKIIADYTNNNYQMRTVVQQDYTLQAIIFDAGLNKDTETVNTILKNMDEVYHVTLHTRPQESIRNILIKIATNAYPAIENVYKNLRRDLNYQDVLTIGTAKELLGFFVFTSIDGNAEITFAVIKKGMQGKGLGSSLMRAFKQQMKFNGFDKIVVDFDTIENKSDFVHLYNFYMQNGFNSVDGREELIEYVL